MRKYARFDDKDFKNDKSTRKHELLECVNDVEPIVIEECEVINVFSKISVKKACGPDKISAFS